MLMNALWEIQNRLLKHVDRSRFTRPLEHQIDWSQRLIGIKGARGVGKTTILLKRIQQAFETPTEALYASLDNWYFANHSLIDLADAFYKQGGKTLFLDEVHKYVNWSQEVKNIYDSYPDLSLVITSSSMLQMLSADADLSRRMTLYDLPGLSFREYLNIETSAEYTAVSLQDLQKHHVELANHVAANLRPLKYFGAYLKTGYYPFYLEGTAMYGQKLMHAINAAIEVDLPFCHSIDVQLTPKIKQLLRLVAVSPPMQPNVSKLSSIMGVSRPLVLKYFDYLSDGGLLNLLSNSKRGYTTMSKPKKVYLHNTNIGYAVAPETVDKGSQRETFFLNQLAEKHDVYVSDSADFEVEGMQYEVGGKNKGFDQLQGQSGYVVADDIEVGFGQKIPLWLFGFLL